MSARPCSVCGADGTLERLPFIPAYLVCASCGRAWAGKCLWWIEERNGVWSLWSTDDDTVSNAAPFQTRHEALLFLEKVLAAKAPALRPPTGGDFV